MRNEKSGKVTLANIITILGLVLLLVCLWLGKALKSGELGGISALIAVGITIATALVLWVMIKAKGAETDTSKWKIVEFSTLALYIALAVLTAPIALHFFSVLSNKDKLQKDAQSDIAAIQQAIEDFKKKEQDQLNATCQGLENVLSNKENGKNDPKQDVITFIEDEVGANYKNNFGKVFIEEWKKKWKNDIEIIDLSGMTKKDLDGVEPTAYDKTWSDRIASCKNTIRNWQLLKIPSAVGNIQSLSEEVDNVLNTFSKNAPYSPIFYDSKANIYTIGKHKANKYPIKNELQDAIKNLSPYTVIGIAAMVLIHLLVLFNYFMAYRTHRQEKRRSENDGGIILNI